MTISGFDFRTSFIWKAAIAILLVVLGDLLFFRWELGGGNFGIYGLALLVGMVGARHAVRRDKRAWVALVAAGLFAFAMIYDASLLAWTLFWIAAGLASLLPASGRFDDGWRWFQRLLLHGLRAPFAPSLDAIRVLRVRRVRPVSRISLRATLPVLALPLIGSAIIVALFSAANPVLEKLLAAITLPDFTALNIARMMLWALLFIMAWSLIHPRLPKRILPTFDGSGDLAMPGVTVASVRLSLILFNLLFAMQNLMDAAYMSGFAPMPEGITLAEYAHRGAYPLIVTALLAALFVIVTLRPGSATAAMPVIRKLVLLWIAQNIILVGSSIWRTLDYIDVYSLTVLRISALAWMVLVAVGLLLICWRLFAEKSASWLINANLAAAVMLLTTASFIDLGNIAAWWNVRHAREVGGQGAALDLCYLDRLGGSSLLPLIALERRTDLKPAFREKVQTIRVNIQKRLKWQMQHQWTMLGEQRLKQAEQEIKLIRPVKTGPFRIDCEYGIIQHFGDAPVPNTAAVQHTDQDYKRPILFVPDHQVPSALTAEARK